MQRTLILYPGNIPEFAMSEDILSLQEVSSYLGAATDFSPNKSCKSLNIMVPGAEDWQAATAVQSLSNASPTGRVTKGNQSLLTLRGTKNKSRKLAALYFLVPGAGIEPARPYRTTDFKSVASAYSAIRAYHCFLFFS